MHLHPVKHCYWGGIRLGGGYDLGGDTTDLMAACLTTFISVHEIVLYIHIPLQNYYYIVEGFGI